MNSTRLNSIRQRMQSSGLDSLLITHTPNIRYITGYAGDNAFAVITSDSVFLFVYKLNREYADETVTDDITVFTIDKTIASHFSSLDQSFWGTTTGYEQDAITCSTFTKIEAALENTTMVTTSGIVEECRHTKDALELDSIAASQSITDTVFNDIIHTLKEGVSERDIASEIEYRFRLAGGEKAAFDTIVAFGPKSSMPHAVPDGTTLRNGDIVLIDMGTVVDGYASDMTRTIVFGHATNEIRTAYQHVLEAQEIGIESLCDGELCENSYNVANEVFKAHGNADAFIHSLGHGVGLEVHEAPALSPRSRDTLRNNAVVTIEPGLYYPGKFGIRIEDMLVIADKGARNLTKSPKTLIEL